MTERTAPCGLAALEARLAHDLECLQLPAPRWTPALEHAGTPVADIAIIGGGMAGLALAASLIHLGMQVDVYDEAPAGFEGPWATTARMETLRSPKQLAGPALGIASLSFRAWFEAQWGLDAWQALDKIPRLQWMDYLRWYRHALRLPVHNEHCVTDIAPQPGGLVQLDLTAPGGPVRRWARRVVLATGRAGLGGPLLPPWAAQLPRAHWVHSSEDHDYMRLNGLRVAVVGAGASAMDSAATALEAGAARVHLLVRRADIPRVNKGKGAGHPGFVHGHAALSRPWKWRIRHYINEQQVPPPRNSTLRVSRHANAFFHLGTNVESANFDGQALRLQTTKGPLAVDFLVLSTGFVVDWSRRPMLRRLAPHIRLWQDSYTPPPGEADAELAGAPDLGPAFEFQPRAGSEGRGIERVHCFAYPAALSKGVVTGDIPAISEGAHTLAAALASLLYVEDVELHYANMLAYAEPEVFGDEWFDSPLPSAD